MLFSFFMSSMTFAADEDTVYLQFYFVAPTDAGTDDSPLLKKISSTDPDYSILFGQGLIDEDGYYIPIITDVRGGGVPSYSDYLESSGTTTDDIDYYKMNLVTTTIEGYEGYRVYEATIPVNNLNYINGNVKYEIAYVGTNSTAGGEDVYHVLRAETSNGSPNKLLRAILTDEQVDLSQPVPLLIDGTNRVYYDESPIEIGGELVQRYFSGDDNYRLTITPIDPALDNEAFTIMRDGSIVRELYFTKNYDSTVRINGETSLTYGDILVVQARIYDSTGSTLLFTGEEKFTSNSSSETFNINDFEYESLLNKGDTFDIELIVFAKTPLGSIRQATATLNDVKLPWVEPYKVLLNNATTNSLWTALNFGETLAQNYSQKSFNYDSANKTFTEGAEDGNYAKFGDDVSVNIFYRTHNMYVNGKSTSIDPITYLVYKSNNNTYEIIPFKGDKISSDGNDEQVLSGVITYSSLIVDLEDAKNENGPAYLLLRNVEKQAIGKDITLESTLPIVYIDNLDATESKPEMNGGNTYSEGVYINSDNTLTYKSTEDGTNIIEGNTGVRTYIKLFSYDDPIGEPYSDFERSSEKYIPPTVIPNSGTPHYYTGLSNYYYTIIKETQYENVVADSSHSYDGKYFIQKVMAIDKAGNVEDIDTTGISTANLKTVLINQIAIPTDATNKFTYYVDTIAPYVSGVMQKTHDSNTDLSLGIDLDTALRLTPDVWDDYAPPFKTGDTAGIKVDLEDQNIYACIVNDIYNFSSDQIFNASGSYILSDITVTNTGITDGNHTFFNVTAVDKAGNSTSANINGDLLNSIPSNIALEVYEDHKTKWLNESTQITGDNSLVDNDDYSYRFSKGADRSGSTKPDIYITNINNSGDDMTQVIGIDVSGEKKFYNHGYYKSSTAQTDVNLFEMNSKDSSLNNFYLTPNSKNTVTVTPYGPSGVKGNDYIENVVIDTNVNSSSGTSLTESATYNSSSEKYEFDLDFSKVLELAGLKGYKVKNIVTKINGKTVSSSPTVYYTDSGNADSSYDNHIILSTEPSTVLAGNNITRTVGISKSDVIPGSRCTLEVSVLDSLGSQQDVEFNFLLPEPSVNLKAKTSNSNRIRESNIKVVGESNGNGFGVKNIEEKGE